MKELKLSNSDKIALVDDDDLERVLILSKSWTLCAREVNCRCVRVRRAGKISLHRFTMKCVKTNGLVVDHINGNFLDNRKENLRICSASENGFNRVKTLSKTSSIYKGVSWHKGSNSWRVHVSLEGLMYYGGYFKSEKDAAIKANKLMIKHHGEFAKINTIIL